MTTSIKGTSAYGPLAAKQERTPVTRSNLAVEQPVLRQSAMDLEPSGNARGLRDQVMLSQLAEQLRTQRSKSEATTPRRPIVTLVP